MKSTLQQAAGKFCLTAVLRSPGKEFCNFYIRSLAPQQAAGNALAGAGSIIEKTKMSVLLYSSQTNDDGKGFQQIVETLVPNEHSRYYSENIG